MNQSVVVKDLDLGWIDVGRHAQASLARIQNKGLARVELTIVALGNTPVHWEEANVTRFYPLPTADKIDEYLKLLANIRKPMIP